MKFSIIIPFYKYKNYLKECFQSLKDSTFSDYETLLILDESKEDIKDLVEEYKYDIHLQCFKLENKHGVAAARNMGIEKAHGEYIYFLDSDDYVLMDTLTQLNKVTGNEDIVYGSIKNTWNNKANFLEKLAKDIQDSDDEEINVKELEKIEVMKDYVSSHSNKDQAMAIFHLLENRSGLDNTTVVGTAFKRSFLDKQKIHFNEEMVYYSDFPFIVECLNQAGSHKDALNSIYVKRKHNDPINYPSLRQIKDENRFYERMKAYTLARARTNNVFINESIDRQIISYYLSTFILRLRRSEDKEWKNDYYTLFSKVIENCSENVIKEYPAISQKMIYSIQKNELEKTLKQVRSYLGKKKFEKILENKNELYKLPYYHVYLKKPLLKNVVLFETFNAKNYSDSPKYIYEYLAKNYGDQFEFVWALNTDTKPKYGGKVVKRFSFEYSYYLARAKYLVFNVRPPLWYRKREGQVFLETWHGTPLKRLVFDQEEVTAASPKYKEQFYKQRKDWDYLISANDFSTETLARCFMYEGEMLATGYPRNDLMYDPDKDQIARDIKTKLGIPLDKKTILYAPTWRDDEYYGKGQYKFTLKLDCQKLREELGDEYVILLRTHQYIADNLDTTGLEGFAYNVSKYDDITELYLISDLCITDYSSVFFDYANLRRPILFYTYDMDKYKNQLRGFYIDMNTELPGPLLYTSEEVIRAIKNIDQINEQYKDKYDEFYNRFCHLDDGNASKRVVERVFLNK